RVWAVPAQGILGSRIRTNTATDFSGAFDRTIVGTNATFANFNTGVGTLAAILGDVNVEDSGGSGDLYIDDSGDAIARSFTFSALAVVPVWGGPGLQLSPGFLPGFINATDAMDNYQFAAGSAGDTLNVNATLNGGPTDTLMFGNAGNDNFNISGDGLSDDNIFRGGNDNDNFVMTIASSIGATTGDITGLTIEGNSPSTTVNRDRLIINDNSGLARSLDYVYQNSLTGDVNIQTNVVNNGLFGANLPAGSVNVRTMETLIFNSAGAANDAVRVFGTTGNDILTVAQLPTTAPTATLPFGTSSSSSVEV